MKFLLVFKGHFGNRMNFINTIYIFGLRFELKRKAIGNFCALGSWFAHLWNIKFDRWLINSGFRLIWERLCQTNLILFHWSLNNAWGWLLHLNGFRRFLMLWGSFFLWSFVHSKLEVFLFGYWFWLFSIFLNLYYSLLRLKFCNLIF